MLKSHINTNTVQKFAVHPRCVYLAVTKAHFACDFPPIILDGIILHRLSKIII